MNDCAVVAIGSAVDVAFVAGLMLLLADFWPATKAGHARARRVMWLGGALIVAAIIGGIVLLLLTAMFGSLTGWMVPVPR